MLKLSNEQLTKLVLYTAGINSILAEALLNVSEPEKQYGNDKPTESVVKMDVFVIDPNRLRSETEPLNLDALCGDWTGGRRKPALSIFKAEPGYMSTWGKKPKKGEVGDCYLIEEVNGNLCIRMGNGYVYLSHDTEKDTLLLFPGGEYTRISTDKK